MALDIKKQSLKFEIKQNNDASLSGNDSNIIVEIPTDKIIEIPEQDFKIHQETVDIIAKGIVTDGQLSPCIVTPHETKKGYYELLAGRHRCRACIQAGVPTVKCTIRNGLTETQKQLIIINSNLDRNNDYAPSELAWAYRHKFELLTNSGSSAMKQIAEENNISKKKVYRYIRLTHLIKPLLDRVDSGSLPLIAAVDLSYLTEAQQNRLFSFLINHSDCKINTFNATLIKENPDNLEEIFFSDDFDVFDDEDNLSTSSPNVQAEPTRISSSSRDTSVSSVGKTKKSPVDNLSTSEDKTKENNSLSIIDLDETSRDMICDFFIDQLELDRYICKLYTTIEIVSKIKKEYYGANPIYKGTQYNFLITSKKVTIKFDRIGDYLEMKYDEIINLCRAYIRNNYTSSQIAKAFSK